jgi:short-subunit dehydrogenase
MNAIVTGGTKGIGKAIVEVFAEEQMNIAICSRSMEDLETYKADLNTRFPNIEILIYQADLSKKEETIAFADFIKSKWDKINVLVNNAGVFLPGEIHKEEDGILESQIETNLYSAYHFTRALMPVFLEQKDGHIFNMCSIASQIAYPNGGSYSISKFALLGFSKVLREELKDKGIKVSAILPGATWSNSWAGADLPHDRIMEAKDIAYPIIAALKMSKSAVMEEIVLRPQLGDL